MGYRAFLAAAAAALLLAGCGSSSSSEPAGAPRSWTLSDVVRRSGLQRNADGLTYRIAGHPRCVARVLLRSSDEVRTYRNSGDVVATNPDRSAGVKVDPGQPASCRRLFTQAFNNVR